MNEANAEELGGGLSNDSDFFEANLQPEHCETALLNDELAYKHQKLHQDRLEL